MQLRKALRTWIINKPRFIPCDGAERAFVDTMSLARYGEPAAYVARFRRVNSLRPKGKDLEFTNLD